MKSVYSPTASGPILPNHTEQSKRKSRLKIKHFQRHYERPFLRHEREHTTVLVGGLSPAHDFLFEGALKGLGYKAKALPPTNIEAFHLGREYGNNGYCNPGYFTVGNLILYLRQLAESGIPKKDIVENYVFFTIGCNAPCRFGMLEAEYRMALEDSGFDGFRILVFENEGGLRQRVEGNGFDVDPEFFLATVNALNIADTINNYVYANRPYEKISGSTNEVRDRALQFIYEKLSSKKRFQLLPFWKSIFQKIKFDGVAFFISIFIQQISSSYYTNALKQVKSLFNEIEVDRLKPKPKVKITGEFWAMTTVGDGNFDLFNFLEEEGSELLIEPVASLIQFLFSKGMLRHRNKRKLILREHVKSNWNLQKRLHNYIQYQKKLITLKVGLFLFRREYHRLLKALGGNYHEMINQPVLQKLAQRYYNINIEGGEGYMEITKNIYYHLNFLSHMVISLKPFGCMPSTQSDGAQALVMEDHKDMIYLPVETAGEGKTNAQSRVLMALGEARLKTKVEIEKAKKSTRSSYQEITDFIENNAMLKKPGYKVPHFNGVVSQAANMIYHVDDLISQSPIKNLQNTFQS